MPPQHSQNLNDLLLKERFEPTKLEYSLSSQIHRLLEDERHYHISPHVWVFWGSPYQAIFDGIGRCLRHRRTLQSNNGLGRPMHVYDGSKHTLHDFLDLPEDGGIAFVHKANCLRVRGHSGTDAYFKGFVALFKAKLPRNQIVFMSEGRFFREFDDMKHVKVTDGVVDVGWYWPQEGPDSQKHLDMEGLVADGFFPGRREKRSASFGLQDLCQTSQISHTSWKQLRALQSRCNYMA